MHHKMNMDLYDDSLKMQEMMDSDVRSMRSEIDDYLSELPRTPGSPILSTLPPVSPMDIGDSTLDSELSDDGRIGWMNSSHIYNVSSDLDSISGLLVNPETALPVSVTQLASTTAISMPTSIAGTVNVTLTPNKKRNNRTSNEHVTLPVQVFTTATLVSEGDSQSQVNLTVTVPTTTSVAAAQSAVSGSQVRNLFSFKKILESEDSTKPKSRQKQNSKLQQSIEENAYPKPAYSYSCLIAMALKNSKTGSLPVNEIYDFMTENFPYFKTAPNGWKNSVRHNLSLNKCFEKIEKPTSNGAQRKGYLWALNPAKAEKMEEELQKWSSKDPAAIRKSMAKPERLELIEKGKLKSSGDVSPIHDVKTETEEEEADDEAGSNEKEHGELNSMKNVELKTSDSCFGSDMVNSDFSTLGDPDDMDSVIPDLDFPKGIWENLCDDRLSFINDSPMNSSSPKHLCTAPNSMPEEDAFSVRNCPSIIPKSFVHASYIYSCTDSSSAFTKSTDLLRKSNASSPEKAATCDA